MAMPSNNYLPEEVVVEIMSWLVPESLLRFKIVCKRWYSLITSLIEDPEFVPKHLHNAHNNMFYRTTLLVHYEFNATPGLRHSLTYLTRFRKDGTDEDKYFHRNTSDISENVFIVEAFHCNGIIYLIHSTFITLLNPSLNEVKKIYNVAGSICMDHQYGRVERMGFGCDSRGDNYKLVRFLYIYENEYLRAEVYNFKTDYSWREITFPMKFYSCLYSHVYYKGACYWLISLADNVHVLSFDVSSEVFHVIPLSVDLWGPKPNNFSSCLIVWGDSIYFFWYYGERRIAKSIQMWVMYVKYDSDHVGGCNYAWRNCEKKFRPLEGIRSPLTFWNSDELLIGMEDGSIISYNLHTQKTQNLCRPGFIMHSGHYVKSLVSVEFL